ncbi:MAG: hypothetical protein LBB21_01945 [Holosporaceae bacterium]|jgi:hypothetical protein|nr:hypothetical protein [Holosporaceae bacterium]
MKIFIKCMGMFVFLVCAQQQCMASRDDVLLALGCSIRTCFLCTGIPEDYRMYGYDGANISHLSKDIKNFFKAATKDDLRIDLYITRQMCSNTYCSGELYRYEYKDFFFASFYRNRISRSLLYRMRPSVCEAMLKELYHLDPFLIINGSDDIVIRYMTPLNDAVSGSHVLLMEHLIGAERSKCINLTIRNIFGSNHKSEMPPAVITDNPLLVSCNDFLKQIPGKFYNFFKIGDIVDYNSINNIISAREPNGTFEKLLKYLDNNKQLLKKKFRAEALARNMIISKEVEEQALNLGSPALLIQLSIPDVVVIIRTLFPRGMFHLFSNAEDSLIMHLHPQKLGFCRNVWSKITNKTSQVLSQEDKTFWLECIIGAIRSRAIKQPINEVSLSKFFGLENVLKPTSIVVATKQNVMCSGMSPDYGLVISNLDYIDLASRVVCSIYTDEGLGNKIDPEMSNSDPPDWSKVKQEIYQALVDAFRANRAKISEIIEDELKAIGIEADVEMRNFLVDRAAGCLVLTIPSDYAVILIRTLFPDGLLHLFKGAEYVLITHLEPKGRELTAAERSFWMQCLEGAERAKSINEDIANPMRGFGLDAFSKYKVTEKKRAAQKANQKQPSNCSEPYKQICDENEKHHED